MSLSLYIYLYISVYLSVSRLSFIQTSEEMLKSISNPKALGLDSKFYYREK